MTDKKVKELANEILQAYFFDYVDVDVAKAVEIIRKYIPKDTVLVNLDQYTKWQEKINYLEQEYIRLNQTITPAKIRKETTKEIVEDAILLYREVIPLQDRPFVAENAFICGIRKLAKKYGVEVEQ